MNRTTFFWAAHLLRYPDAEWQNLAQGTEYPELPQLQGSEPPLWASQLMQYAACTPLLDMQCDFVDTFDHSTGACLYLTTHAYGDSPLQGRALAALSELYRDAGYMFLGKEMPDYLPVMLEFLAVAPPWAAACLCEKFAPAAQKISQHVAARQSPWAGLFAAVAEAMQACLPADQPAAAADSPTPASPDTPQRHAAPRVLCEVPV